MELLATAGTIFGTLAFLIRALRKSFQTGLAFAVTMLVWLPTALRFELPGSLPDLTIHRLILLTLFIFWVRRSSEERVPGYGDFFSPFRLWCAIGFLSLLCTSISYMTGLKRYLDTLFEFFMFYVIISSSVRHEDDALKLVRAAWLGILVVGGFAVLEKYTGFNPVDRFLPSYARIEGTYADVLSTYPHRILLGTVMAMGWPLALALLAAKRGGLRISSLTLWTSVLVMLGACYFAMSRGPWLASILVMIVLILFATTVLRSRLLVVAGLAGVLMLARPGVADSILGLFGSTTQAGSQKEGTFKYRLELWSVAWNAISKSPVRTMVGYGPGAGMEMDVEWTLSYRGTDRQIESWDNHYAYDLLQSGIFGLLATVILVTRPAFLLWSRIIQATGWRKDFLVALLASSLAMVFMMTNVLIFAKQLHFLFWTLAVCGMKIGVSSDPEGLPTWEDGEGTENAVQEPESIYPVVSR